MLMETTETAYIFSEDNNETFKDEIIELEQIQLVDHLVQPPCLKTRHLIFEAFLMDAC